MHHRHGAESRRAHGSQTDDHARHDEDVHGDDEHELRHVLLQLDPKQSPHATAAFVELVKRGYFDNTTFHRIVPGFVIQGGDPTASGNGGPGFSTVDKPPADASYTHGVVAMAKTALEAPGTAGSQFFVVTAEDSGLTPDYAIIGKITKGLPVVDRIGKLGDANDPNGTPTEVVEIEKATVTES